jgi:hypothetical protein
MAPHNARLVVEFLPTIGFFPYENGPGFSLGYAPWRGVISTALVVWLIFAI